MSLHSIWGKRLKDIRVSKKYGITGRTVAAPLVALTAAVLVFVYARSSIYHAKRNAVSERNRE